MANPPTSRNNKPPQLSEDTVRELLAVQRQEIALRTKEIERDSAEISLNKSVAQQSIEAQERDRKHDREEHTRRQRSQQNFVLLILAALLVFSLIAMYMNHVALVMDMAKVAIGFLGGFGLAASRLRKKHHDDLD